MVPSAAATLSWEPPPLTISSQVSGASFPLVPSFWGTLCPCHLEFDSRCYLCPCIIKGRMPRRLEAPRLEVREEVGLAPGCHGSRSGTLRFSHFTNRGVQRADPAQNSHHPNQGLGLAPSACIHAAQLLPSPSEPCQRALPEDPSLACLLCGPHSSDQDGYSVLTFLTGSDGGCCTEDTLNHIGRIITLRTSGHSTLVRARVAMEGCTEGTGGMRHVCQSREVDRRERPDKVPRSGSERQPC